MNNFRNSGYADILTVTVVLTALALGSAFVASPLMFLYPLPVIILAVRRGFKESMLALAGADIIVAAALGPVLGSVFYVVFTSVAAVMSWFAYKKEKPSRAITYGAGAFMLSFAAIILILQAAAGINFISVMTDTVEAGFSMYANMAQEAGQSIQVEQYMKYMQDAAENSKAFIENFFPSMLIAMSVMVAALNYFIASWAGVKLAPGFRQLKKMQYMSFPRSFIMAMAALLVVSYGLKLFNANYSVVQLNILSLCYMGMFVQGLAVTKFFLTKWKLPVAGRAVIIAVVLLLPPLGQALAVIGMIDMVFDLRKLKGSV